MCDRKKIQVHKNTILSVRHGYTISVKLLLFFVLCTVLGADTCGPEMQVSAAILVDYETNTVLYEKNADIIIPPASLTKLMTMHLVLQEVNAGRLSLNQVIEVPEEAYWKKQAPGSSLMFLEPGQHVTVEELLLGLAVSSGNDAAIAAAILVAGSVDAFIMRMNLEAASLGFRHIHFKDTAGLDPRNCITARDFAGFCRLYVNIHPHALDRFHCASEFTYPTDKNLPNSSAVKQITGKNRNLLLQSYEGLDGLKTGYIEESGYNVALTAARGGMRLIAVLLGGSGENHTDGKQRLARDGELLLDYGYENFTQVRPSNIDYGTVRVWKGKADYSDLVPAEEILLCVAKEQIDTIEYMIDRTAYLIAPVTERTEAGTITVSCGGKILIKVPLITAGPIERAGPIKRLFHSIGLLSQRIRGETNR